LDWWLVHPSPNSRTPTFDIASTCHIKGKPGLLLIEAKAHDQELSNEVVGKRLKANASAGSLSNHERIAAAITGASQELGRATSMEWHLSRDRYYQMSNRLAWSWKLTDLGFSVVLVYLGFLNATEVSDLGTPLTSHEEWESVVWAQSHHLFPTRLWNKKWTLNDQHFAPLIRSASVELPAPAKRG
jgi:hypothetical protein